MRLLILILFSLAFNVAECCTCQSLPKIDNEQYNLYDFIATGKVIKILDDRRQLFIYLKVETLYKGNQGKDTIQIISPNTEGACGIFPKAGEQWFVFAYTEGGKLHTTLCTRTKSMNPQAWNYNKFEIDDDISFLENKKYLPFNFVLPVCLVAAGLIVVLWWMRNRKSR